MKVNLPSIYAVVSKTNRPGTSDGGSVICRKAFTLVEVLVSTAIVAFLLLLALTSIQTLTARSGRTKCLGNLRQIGVATAAYLSDNNGWLPIAHETYSAAGGAITGTWGDSKSKTGAWYWNLAPYLGILRFDTNKVYLGETGSNGLPKPCVFTCPRHGADDSSQLAFPALRPVSYAPSIKMRSREAVAQIEGNTIYRVNIKQLPNALRKVWLMDSTNPAIANTAASYWEEGEPMYRVSKRHSYGCNALFFDGHVKTIFISEVTEGPIEINLGHWFDPYVGQ